VTHNFGWGTVGFADLKGSRTDDGYPCQVAVCILPGTEIAFDEPVKHKFNYPDNKTGDSIAIFRQTDKGYERTHHDTLEFPNGEQVKLTHLLPGQYATVLQLPATPKNEVEEEEQRRVEYAG